MALARKRVPPDPPGRRTGTRESGTNPTGHHPVFGVMLAKLARVGGPTRGTPAGCGLRPVPQRTAAKYPGTNVALDRAHAHGALQHALTSVEAAPSRVIHMEFDM